MSAHARIFFMVSNAFLLGICLSLVLHGALVRTHDPAALVFGGLLAAVIPALEIRRMLSHDR